MNHTGVHNAKFKSLRITYTVIVRTEALHYICNNNKTPLFHSGSSNNRCGISNAVMS